MVQFLSKNLGASLLLASTAAVAAAAAAEDTMGWNIGTGCITRELQYSEVVDMDELAAANEALTLDLEWMAIDPGFGDSDGYGNNADEPVCGSTKFMTRALGGSVPGPTLTVSPGTTMRVIFKNKLTYQSESFSSRKVVEVDGKNVFTTEPDLKRLNKFNDPDIANLHFHGLHVSGVLPSDDTTLEVLPQEEYEYVIDIPADHEPGLHWVHPHHHGSSTLQLVGGAALALIVKDPEEADADSSTGLLPAEIREAPQRVMVLQDWDFSEALQTARHANDLLITESFTQIKGGESIGQRFVTVNGKYQPVTDIQAGKWERWRILYAGWQDLPLELGFTSEGNPAECEFHMLAKDGIYLSDYPRGPMMTSKNLPIPPGGRADFMVRCNKAGATTRFEALSRQNTLVVNCVKGEGDAESNSDAETPALSPLLEDEFAATPAVVQQRSANSLTAWKKSSSDLPEYLQSVATTTASDGCTCKTEFSGYDDTSRVNGLIYRPGNNYMHTSYLGAVVERSLKGMHEHSYHQHVYPYQLIDFPNQDSTADNEYFKIGDWHDTYLDKNQNGGEVTIRYKTTDIAGKIMVHCHNTLHADNGMIQKEYVRNTQEEDNRCMCEIFGPIGGSGIVDDIDSPHVIGAVEVDPIGALSSARPGAFVGFSQLLPVLVAGIASAALVGFGV